MSSATQTVLTKGISGGGGLLKPANNALIGFEYDPAMGKTTFRLKVNLSQIRDNSIENLARNYFIIEDHTIHVLVDGKTGEVGLSGTVEDGQAQALFEDLTTLASQKGVVFKGMYLSMETLISSFPSLTPSFPRKRESRELDSRFRGNDGEKRNDGKTGESQKAILTFNGRELILRTAAKDIVLKEGDVSRLAKAVGLIQGNAAFQNSVAEIRAGENRSGDTGVLDVKFELSLESSEVQNSLMDLVKNRAGDPSLEDILIPLSILQNKIGSGDLKNVLLTLQFDSQGEGALVVSLKDDATLPQDWRESLTESGAERFIDSKGIARFTFKLNRDGSLQASNLRSDLVGSGQIITAASDVIVAGVKFDAQGEKVRVNEGTSPYGYLVVSHISQPNGKPISVAGNFSAQKIYSDMKLSGLTNSAPIHRLSLEGMAVNYADRAGQRGTIPYEVKVVVGLPPQNFWQSLWTTPKKLVVDTGQGEVLIRREFSVGSVVSIGVDIPNGHVSKVSNNSGDEVVHFIAPAQNQTLLTIANPVYNVVGKISSAQSLIVWNKEKSGMKDAELFGVTFTLDTGIVGQVEKASSARLYDGQGRVIQNMMDILMGTLAAANSDLRIHVHSPSPQPQEGEGIKTMPQVQERLKMVALHSEDAPTSRIGSAEPSNITDGSLGGLIHVVGDKVYMDSRGNQPSEIYKGMGMDPSKVEINLDGRMVVELGTTDGKKIFGGEKVFQVNRLSESGQNVTVSVTQAQWTLVGDRIAITGGLFDGQRFGIELGGSGEKGEVPQNVQTVARVHSVKNNMAFVSGRVEMRDGQFLLNGGQLTLETGVEVVGLKAVGGEWTVKFGGPGGNISLVVSPDGQGYLEKKGENGTTTRITGRYVTGEHIGLLTNLKKNELGFEGQGFIGAINQVTYEKLDSKGVRTGKGSVLNVLSERDVFIGTFNGEVESPRLTTYDPSGERKNVLALSQFEETDLSGKTKMVPAGTVVSVFKSGNRLDGVTPGGVRSGDVAQSQFDRVPGGRFQLRALYFKEGYKLGGAKGDSATHAVIARNKGDIALSFMNDEETVSVFVGAVKNGRAGGWINSGYSSITIGDKKSGNYTVQRRIGNTTLSSDQIEILKYLGIEHADETYVKAAKSPNGTRLESVVRYDYKAPVSPSFRLLPPSFRRKPESSRRKSVLDSRFRGNDVKNRGEFIPAIKITYLTNGDLNFINLSSSKKKDWEILEYRKKDGSAVIRSANGKSSALLSRDGSIQKLILNGREVNLKQFAVSKEESSKDT
ncbi:MAG: hypothetical protein HYY07_05295, partial [Elusimicrobia bacterium]|nr:hypothetical protein [Elusimicrobiota bacterium]